jgi:hypothetical protein
VRQSRRPLALMLCRRCGTESTASAGPREAYLRGGIAAGPGHSAHGRPRVVGSSRCSRATLTQPLPSPTGSAAHEPLQGLAPAGQSGVDELPHVPPVLMRARRTARLPPIAAPDHQRPVRLPRGRVPDLAAAQHDAAQPDRMTTPRCAAGSSGSPRRARRVSAAAARLGCIPRRCGARSGPAGPDAGCANAGRASSVPPTSRGVRQRPSSTALGKPLGRTVSTAPRYCDRCRRDL